MAGIIGLRIVFFFVLSCRDGNSGEMKIQRKWTRKGLRELICVAKRRRSVSWETTFLVVLYVFFFKSSVNVAAEQSLGEATSRCSRLLTNWDNAVVQRAAPEIGVEENRGTERARGVTLTQVLCSRALYFPWRVICVFQTMGLPISS